MTTDYNRAAWYLIGVTSWGAADCETSHYPSVFARVSSMRDWLDGIVGQDWNTCQTPEDTSTSPPIHGRRNQLHPQ